MKTAKVHAALLRVHDEYMAFLARDSEDRRFSTTEAGLTIIENRVVIDATASGHAEDLLQDLMRLGAVHASATRRLVSCQLPITAISVLGQLDSLGFARPAYVTTR